VWCGVCGVLYSVCVMRCVWDVAYVLCVVCDVMCCVLFVYSHLSVLSTRIVQQILESELIYGSRSLINIGEKL
jgi:hypothetical protein